MALPHAPLARLVVQSPRRLGRLGSGSLCVRSRVPGGWSSWSSLASHRRAMSSGRPSMKDQQPPAKGEEEEEGHSQEAKTESLPAPPEKGEPATVTLDVGSGTGVRLDGLGPLVVNRDGSTGRVANWAEMTEAERATTLKLLSKRNRQRLDGLSKGET